MDIDKGLARQLPPADDNKRELTDIDRSQLLTLTITDSGALLVNDSVAEMKQLNKVVQQFVATSNKETYMIAIDCSRKAPYNAYFNVQQALVVAYNDMRETYAKKHYHKAYGQLSADERQEVRNAVPQRIAEIRHADEQEE